MQIAILGVGQVGSTLGRLWHAAGHDVTFAARGAARPQELAAELGVRAHAAPVADAVAGAEVVLVAVPGPAVTDVLQAAGPVDGHVMIDAANSFGQQRVTLSRRRAISSGCPPMPDKLLDLYKRVPDFVLPKERMNEVASFVRGGLQDLSISRTTFNWGIPVPGNDKHIMYVWVDALTNYITAVGFPDTESEKFQRYWPADLHVIGKDIVRFHAVYWPAFLMSAGIEVPRRIFSHGFLFNRGEKMSKSVGNVIDPFALADAYGVDQLRYFLLREVPFGQDGNYSHEAIVNRINADLANDLGNLAQRSLTIVARSLGGALPEPGAFTANDQAILSAADAMIGKAREAMETQQLHQVLNAVWAVVADANRYFAGEAPWALAKTDPARKARCFM